MLNCKPGDLAVIIRSPQAPENIGKIVHVIRAASEGEIVEGWSVCLSPNFPAWIVESAGLPMIWASRLDNGEKGPTIIVRKRVYADWCLKPIRHPGDDEIDAISTTKKQSTSA